MKRALLILLIISVFTAHLFSQPDKPVAVVLSGGGARGAYQIGVWKAMIDCGIEIGGVYGVSVGAINGAGIAAGDFEKAKKLWLELENNNVMNMSEATSKLIEGDVSLRNIVDSAYGLLSKGGIDVSPLEQLLRLQIDEDEVRASGVDYGLAAYSLTDAVQKYFYIDDIPEGQLVDYILASANFPLFKRQFINGEEFIDGGVYKNLVVGMIDDTEYEKAVIITLGVNMPADLLDRISGYSDYGFEEIFINPGIDLGSLLDFRPGNALSLMRYGYLDGLKAFGELSGRSYYIYGRNTIRKMYLQLDADERKTAVELLETEYTSDVDFNDGNSTFDSLVVPQFLIFDDDDTAILEFYAFSMRVSKEKLYSEKELIDEIVSKYIQRPNFSVYYNRFLDFLSYLSLLTDNVRYSDEEFDNRFLKSYTDFRE